MSMSTRLLPGWWDDSHAPPDDRIRLRDAPPAVVVRTPQRTRTDPAARPAAHLGGQVPPLPGCGPGGRSLQATGTPR